MGNNIQRAASPSIAHTFLEKIRLSGLLAIWFAVFAVFTITYFVINQSGAVTGDGWEIDHGRAIADAIITSASSITQFSSGGYDNPTTSIRILMALESIIGLIIYALLFAKLVAYKQDTILEEIQEINQEETFTNFRRGLSLVRADILVIVDKLEGKNIKQKEIKDLWIIFSGLDQTLTNIKSFVMPDEKPRAKPLQPGKFELLLSSMKLTMAKVLELVKSLNANSVDWKEEMLLTSIHYDMQIIRDMMEHQLPRTTDKKLIEKISSTKIILDELEQELRAKNETVHPNEQHQSEGEVLMTTHENLVDHTKPEREEDEVQQVIHHLEKETTATHQHHNQNTEKPAEHNNSSQPEIEMQNQEPPHDPRIHQYGEEHKHQGHNQ